MSPFVRTIAISLLSPRERSNATRSPVGDHTGFESLRPRAMGTSGRTNSGSIPAGSPALEAAGSSAAAGNATAGSARAASRAIRGRQRCIAFGSARLRFLDLIAVSAGSLAGLRKRWIALELFREEVEIFSPREARAIQHRRLLRDQIQLVVRQRRVVIGVVHRLVVLLAQEEARVLLGGLQRLDRLGEVRGRGGAIAFQQAVAFLAIRMAEVGEGDRELLVDELLVLGQRQHGLELRDRAVVVLLVVDVDGRRRWHGVDLEQRIVGREQELARFTAFADFDLVGELLVAVAVQRERIVAAEPQWDFRLTVRPGRAGPLAVQVDAGARKRVDIRADAAFRGEEEVGAFTACLAFARDVPHHAISDLHLRALLERCDLGERGVVLAAFDLHPAGLAVTRHLAALTKRRRGERELGAAADAPVLADIDAIALLLLGDHRALEREALDHVARDVAHRAVDPAGTPRARDLRENDFAVRGVEFDLDEVAAIVLRDAPEHDHVHGRAQGSVLPALGNDAVDIELALIDLGLQPICRYLAERRELKQLGRKRLLGLGSDLLQVHPRRVAADAVDADADRLGRGRVEVPLEVDRTFKLYRGSPRRGNIAGRCERDHDLLARLSAVIVRVTALRVGLADGLAVYAHAQPGHSARAAVLVGKRLDRHHGLAVERDFDYLARIERVGRAVAAVAALGHAEFGSLRRLLTIEVHDLAFGVGHPCLLSSGSDLGIRQRGAFLAHAQGHVALGVEIGLDMVRVDLVPLRQLHEEGRFPRLDAVAGRLLAHRHFDLATGFLAQPLHEHALGVGHAERLAIYGDLRLCRGLAVDARLDLDVEALAASAEQDGGEQDGKKTQGCGHEESLGYGAGSKGDGGCARSHRGRLDIDFAGIDDLVLVGGRAFDRLPLGLLDLRQLELDLLAEEGADLDCLGLRLVADAARLHLVDAGLDAALGRLEFALLVHGRS